MEDSDRGDLGPDKEKSESLGTLLAKARINKGMDQREAARRLGLSLVLIRALEDNAFQQLGAPVFVRGYLSRYARLLGLPEQDILERYRRLGISEMPPLRVARSVKPQAKMSDAGVRWFSYLLMLAVVGWLIWLGIQQVATPPSELARPADSSPPREMAASSPRPESPPPDTKAAAPEQPRSAAPEPAMAIAPPPPAAAEPGIGAPSLQEAVPPPQVGTPAQTSAPVDQAVPPPAPGVPELVLEFDQDCWVNIKDANGNRLAYGLMKADTVSTLSGPAPFSVILGNSSAARIRLNGQVVDPALYVKRGGVSRFVLEAPKSG